MTNPCYDAGVAHIPDPNAAPFQLISVLVPTAEDGADPVDGDAANRTGLNTATVLVQVGAATGTPDGFTVDAKLQHCSTSDGTFADVPGASIDTIDAESTAAQATFSLAGVKQFVRVELTVAFDGGTDPTVVVGASLLLSP